MKSYPSIPKKNTSEASKFWCFDKLDGSNIRVEWTKKKGFVKFGTRTRLLGSDQGILYKAEGLAKKEEEKFAETFKSMKVDKATIFFEFYGSNSFAGNHIESDEHKISLIDVDVASYGLLDPEFFVDIFGTNQAYDCAKLLYCGPIDALLIEQVKTGTLMGMTFEGIVAKASRAKRFQEPIMLKIKNEAWIQKVKSSFDESQWETLL